MKILYAYYGIPTSVNTSKNELLEYLQVDTMEFWKSVHKTIFVG